MNMIRVGNIDVHYRLEGDPNGRTIVFANSLGTDFRLWDDILPRLPEGLRFLRYDKRGHGLSTCPGDEFTIDELVEDCAGLMKTLGIERCLFVGLSIGGLIAQGMAAKYPQMVDAMVLSNTGAKIGTAELWEQRIAAVRENGIESIADDIIQRWFSIDFHQNRKEELHGWRNMLTRTPLNGYLGCSVGIAASDFTSSTATLTLPTLAIAGTEDGSTPPELLKSTADLIPGSQLRVMDGVGHLPCVENPDEYAGILTEFIKSCGYA